MKYISAGTHFHDHMGKQQCIVTWTEGADKVREAHKQHLHAVSSGLQSPVRENVWVNTFYEGVSK